MSTTFWRQIHGASTHFPLVLLLASVVFDFIAWRSRDAGMRRGLHAAGFGSAVVGMLGGIAAGIAGLILTRGRMLGGGLERTHHFFVWPALVTCVTFVAWRLTRRGRIPERRLGTYFTGMSLSVLLMMGAGYSGGELLLAADSASPPVLAAPATPASLQDQLTMARAGRQLFLKNCAHCHGAEAHGEEGPDLHNLDWTDQQIATRIRNGKKGQMTAFSGKLSPQQISDLTAYLHTLK